MAIKNAQLTTTQLDVLEVPDDGSVDGYAITNVLVCNTYDPNDAAASTHGATFDMHLISDAQGALDNKITCVVRELSLPAGETFTFDSEKIVLEPGAKISFVAQVGYPNYGPSGTNPASGQYTDLAATVSYLEV